mmetsp:Transcript_53704/g.136258  ORF Transcript_53704/g.136258 Transcript_53704/m.136258 type:complete len:255 (-) Transcript_53704:246-1010(-)
MPFKTLSPSSRTGLLAKGRPQQVTSSSVPAAPSRPSLFPRRALVCWTSTLSSASASQTSLSSTSSPLPAPSSTKSESSPLLRRLPSLPYPASPRPTRAWHRIPLRCVPARGRCIRLLVSAAPPRPVPPPHHPRPPRPRGPRACSGAWRHPLRRNRHRSPRTLGRAATNPQTSPRPTRKSWPASTQSHRASPSPKVSSTPFRWPSRSPPTTPQERSEALQRQPSSRPGLQIGSRVEQAAHRSPSNLQTRAAECSG